MSRKAKRNSWIARITVTAFMLSLTSSCYLKNDDDPAMPYYENGINSSGLTGKELNEFVSSVKKLNGQAESHYKLALHFQKNKRHKLAIEELNRALMLDSSFARAHNAKGVSYDMLGKYTQAIKCYQLALEVDTNLDYVLNNIGYSYLNTGNLNSAIESFQEAIQLNAESKRYRNNLALAYVMIDRYDMAIDQLKGFEGGPQAGETIAKLAHRLGKKDFEEKIVTALHRIKLENNLTAQTKNVSNKPSVTWKKAESTGTKTVFVRREIEHPEPELEPGSKSFTVEKRKREKTQSESTPVHGSQNQQQIATVIDVFPKPVSIISELTATQNAGITDAEDESEFLGVTGPSKKVLIASPTVESKNSYSRKHIRVMWEDSVDTAQIKTDAAPVHQAGDNHHPDVLIVTRKSTIGNEDSPQGQDKEIDNHFNEFLHLSAFQLAHEPPKEKPHSVSRIIQDTDATAPIMIIKKGTDLRPQSRIKPKIIDVEEKTVPFGRESKKTLQVKSTGNLEIVGLRGRGGTSRKVSPVYMASRIPSENIKGNGFSIFVASRKDKKVTRIPATINEIISKKQDNDIVELEIANGNGVSGIAGKYQKFLKKRGFKVVKISNAKTFEHITTKIFHFKGHRKDVDLLLQEIGIFPDERSIIEMNDFGPRIKIIIGKDIMRQNRVLTAVKYSERRL